MENEYDPIRILMLEHQGFLSRLEGIRDAWKRGPRDLDGLDDLPGRVAEFARFLGRDVIWLHSAKEEKGLFPALRNHLADDGDTVEVVLNEHNALRSFRRTLEQACERLTADPQDDRAIAAVARDLSSVDGLLAQHVVKEDFLLFPMAQELLTRAEVAEVARVCLHLDRLYEEYFGRSHPSPCLGRFEGSVPREDDGGPGASLPLPQPPAPEPLMAPRMRIPASLPARSRRRHSNAA